MSTNENVAPQAQQQQAPGPFGAKNLLMKKMGGGGQFCSPTDNMMSPCTQKLNQTKARHYTKGKPLSLAAQLAAARPKASTLGNANKADSSEQ